MSQEDKAEESGILSGELEEEGDDNEILNEKEQQIKRNFKSESQSNEESKIDLNEEDQNKNSNEQTQINNITSISKQNEDSGDINFHEESYNKESILNNEDDQEEQIIEDEKENQIQKQYSKDQQRMEQNNIIIEASSNSSYQSQPNMIFKTDEVKLKSQSQQNQHNIQEIKQKSQSKENAEQAKKQFGQQKHSEVRIITGTLNDEQQEEEKTFTHINENLEQQDKKANSNYIDQESQKERKYKNEKQQQSENEEEIIDLNSLDKNSHQNQEQLMQIVHQEGYGLHSQYSTDNQAFEQQSPAQNTEIVQKNQRKQSIMVDHQVEDSMFHMENKQNNGGGKSSSASDNGEEIIHGFHEHHAVPVQIKMLKNKSNDSDDPQFKSGGNFVVSKMLQIQQQSHENHPPSSGGVVIVGGANSDNYSYNSPEAVTQKENKNSSPDIMEINFSSSNQTNSFGFQKLSIQKATSNNGNNQNSNNNNPINNSNQGVTSMDSKQYSGSNSYELNYSMKPINYQNDPHHTDEKKNAKQLLNNEEESIDENNESEQNGDIILQQDQATEFSKHLFQSKVEKMDVGQQIKGKQPQSKIGNQNKKSQKNNEYFVVESNNEDKYKVEQSITDKMIERKLSSENQKQSSHIKNNQLNQEQTKTQIKDNLNSKQHKPEQHQNKVSDNEFYKQQLSTKQGETESSQFMTNVEFQTLQNTLSNRNEDNHFYQQYKDKENTQQNNAQNKTRKQSQTIKINSDQLRDDSAYSDASREEFKKPTNIKKQNQQQNKDSFQQQQQQKNMSQNEHLVSYSKQYNAGSQQVPSGTENPLSLSDLNSFSSKLQNNSLVGQSKTLKNVNILYKLIIIFNCVLYGYMIPQYPMLFGPNSKIIYSVYLFVSAVVSLVIKKQFIPDITIFYKIGLGAANILLINHQFSFLVNILFFGQFLISIWRLNVISTRIRSITDVISSSFRPNLEIIGFLIILILLFNLIFNIFNLTIKSSNIFSFSSFEYFKYYILSTFVRDSEFEFIKKEDVQSLSEPMIYFSYFCAFICLYFMKIVVENLLTIVQKVSQEQYYEYVGPHYSCGKFAIFKENEKMNSLYNKKALYSIIQALFMILYSVIQQLANESIAQNQKTTPYVVVASFMRYFSLIFIIYEISIDVLLSSATSICKNLLYILVLFNPQYYRLFAISVFYGFCSHIVYFTVLTNHIATLMLDFALIVFLNYIIYLSYINCEESKQISNIVPQLIMFFITSPFLKGMILRYSEIFEIEEDEDAILSSLNNENTDSYQPDENYEEFDEELDIQDGKAQDIDVSSNSEIKRSLQSNKTISKSHCKKSFQIFSRRNSIRVACLKMVNSQLFFQVKSLLMLIIGVKEFFYFMCSAFSITLQNEFITIATYWETFGESSIFGLIILTNSIAYGFLFNKNSYLSRQFRNLLFFALFVVVYCVQPFIQTAYFGFLRIIYLFYLLPFGIKKLADITNAISRSKRTLFQIIFIFCTIFLIHEIYVSPSIKNKSDYVFSYINQVVYLFSINIFAGAILVEFSKQQLQYQNPNIIWTSIKRKIANHKFNYYFNKQKSSKSQGNILSQFLKSQYHNLIISIITGTFYLLLFLIGLVENYFTSQQQLYDFIIDYDLKPILISGFTYFIILYCLIHISVYNLTPFFCSSKLNKALFFQSLLLLVILVIDIFAGMDSQLNLQIQFIIQLPMLLRTKYMFPIVKFHKCIFRQGIVTQVTSLVMIVCLANYLKDSRTSVLEYLLIIFNLNPTQFIIDSSEGWKNIVLILIIYISNGIFSSILLLDIIRKFDLNEAAQAKNKFKQILSIFENIWDKYKTSNNPSLMKSSNLIYLLVKFDKAIEQEEQGKENTKKKPSKIAYLKRITKMRIKVNEEQCLYYKDLLFYLVSEKFNRIQEENYCYGSMSSFNNMTQSVFYDPTAEDLELSQLSSKRRWKVYNPIKELLYGSLTFATWRRYTKIASSVEGFNDEDEDEQQQQQQSENQSNFMEEEEDSIFFDPSMVPPETIQQQSLQNRKEIR